MDINERLARRLVELRRELGLSIEDLANRSGVSRAMISKIERVESSPTATVLDKLSIGLGILLPDLFGPMGYAEPRLHLRNPVVSRREQPEWRDPDTGYRRRVLTPATATQPLRLSEVHLPPGARCTLENTFGSTTSRQQIWMLEGSLELGLGMAGQATQLRDGDCMAMTCDRPMTFHNPGRKIARCLVAALS